MVRFVPAQYIEKFVVSNLHEKAQMNVFFKYVSSVIFDNDDYIVEDFALLIDDELVESLEYYIQKNRVTAKQTARAYLGNLKNFFSNLEIHYNTYNDYFSNGDFKPIVYEKAEKIIETLNATVNSETASDDEYTNLAKRIEECAHQYSYDVGKHEIDRFVNNRTTDLPNMFRLIRSVCAMRMVCEYGIKNSEIIRIKQDDVDLEAGTIKRGKYTLPLPFELKKDITEYIKIRQYLLSNLEKTNERLFIKHDGESISGIDASDKLFRKVIGEGNPVESKSYAKRCIERMVKEGFSANVIKEITGYSGTIYQSVCDFVDKEGSFQVKLNRFVLPQTSGEHKKRNSKQIRYINCPICHTSIKATAEELVLIKYPGDATLHLACTNCGKRERVKGHLNG